MIYNTIKHDIRNMANLSLLDYCLLESIYLLSNGDKSKYKTWCNAAKSSFEYLASSRTIVTRFNELEKLGWLEFKDETRYLKRTTKKYYDEVYIYVLGVKKLHGGEETAPMKELHTPHEETAPNNNIDNYTNRDRGILPKHSIDEMQKEDSYQELKPYQIAIQDYSFNKWTESLKEAFLNFCEDKYDKSNKKFSGTQAKEIIRQIAIDLETHGVEKVEQCVRVCLAAGWNYKFSYNEDSKRNGNKTEQPQDLEAYLLANYQEKEVRYFKSEGKLETWNALLTENLFKVTNAAKAYKNENISPLFFFEILFMPFGGFLNGNNQERKMESFKNSIRKNCKFN